MHHKQSDPSVRIIEAPPTLTEGWHFVVAPPPRPCPHCGGSGVILDAGLQLEGYCTECYGTGKES